MEKIKKCRACQSEMVEKAFKCLTCGHDQRIWIARHKFLTLVVIIFSIPAVLNGLSYVLQAMTRYITEK